MTKVLLIDDSRLSISALQNMVSKIPGFEVVGSAFNGSEGVAIAKEKKPDLVLLDFVMPDKDGAETAKLLKRELPAIKIIMVTQKELDSGTKGLIGAQDYIQKPITLEKLKTGFAKL